MKIPKLPRKIRNTLVALLLVSALVYVAYAANQLITGSGPGTNVHGPANATLQSVVVSFPNGTTTNVPTCTVAANTFSCTGSIQLTACPPPCGTTASENNNYTLTVNFTANPSGLTLSYSCGFSFGTCTTTGTVPTTSTGAAQAISFTVVGNSAGTGNPSVGITGH